MSCTRRFLMLLGIVVCCAAVAYSQATAVFEAGDGDSVTGNSPANCDWNTLNAGGNTANNGAGVNINRTTPIGTCAGTGATGPNAYSFLVGDLSEKIFTTGGSKDAQPISKWAWTNGGSPDKDTLTHAYSASYTYTVNGTAHKFLAFGAERFAVNGDANIGFWFFHGGVGPICADGGTTCTKNGFSGAHQNGDVLLISGFTNGGSNPVLDVLVWDDSCTAASYPQPAPVGACADTNLKEKYRGNAGPAGLCTATSPACTSVNGVPVNLAWPYATKFGGGSTVPVNGYFEGAVDLTEVLGSSAEGCFTNFLAETRSSQAPSAVLKDFLSGSFPECGFELSKSCACSAVDGNTGTYTYTYGGTVRNTGGAPLYNVTITDTPPSPATARTFTCSVLNKDTTLNWPSTDCVATAGSTNTFTSTSKGLSNTVTATAQTSTTANASTISNSNGDSSHVVTAVCANDQTTTPICVPAPLISVTKSCSTSLVLRNSEVAVQVNYTGSVTNPAGASEALVGVTVNDQIGTDSGGGGGTADSANNPLTLAGCTSGDGKTAATPCTLNTGVTATFSGSYIPSNGVFLNPDGTPIAGRAVFYDKVTAAGTGKVSGTSKNASYTAHCAVCSANSCVP